MLCISRTVASDLAIFLFQLEISTTFGHSKDPFSWSASEILVSHTKIDDTSLPLSVQRSSDDWSKQQHDVTHSRTTVE